MEDIPHHYRQLGFTREFDEDSIVCPKCETENWFSVADQFPPNYCEVCKTVIYREPETEELDEA